MSEFDRRQGSGLSAFQYTGIAEESVIAEALVQVTVHGRSVLLTRHENTIVAFSAVCPHAATDLGRGWVRRGQISCAEHGYRFDVRTGRAVWPPDEGCRLTRFSVVVLEGAVWINFASPE